MAEIHDVIRIECLLLHCQRTLASLLQYLLDEKFDAGSQDGKLSRLASERRDIFENFKDSNYLSNSKAKEISPKILDIRELCEILKAKSLGLLQPLKCCVGIGTGCIHKCLICAEECNETVGCYKRSCLSCGEESNDCREQVFLKSISLVQELCNILHTVDQQTLNEFFTKNKPFDSLPDYKSWESLWRGVQKSMARILIFLCERNSITKEDWKDIDMEMRNVLKRSKDELNFLFTDNLKKFPKIVRRRTIDVEEERTLKLLNLL